MKLLLLLFLLLPSVSFATCEEGTQTSLFEETRPLRDHVTQDQDGLGTCYANAASVLMKSALKNHPDVSYIHAAMTVNAAKPSFIQGDDKSFTWGGNVCDTVNAVAAAGGACPKAASILEASQTLPPEIQAVVFENLGRYFDFFNVASKNPKTKEEIDAGLTKAIGNIKQALSNLRYQCNENKLEPLPMRPALNGLLSFQFVKMAEGSKCREAKKKLLQGHLEPRSFIKEDRILVSVENRIYQEFKAFIEGDPQLTKLLQAYLKNPLKAERLLQQKLAQRVNQFFLRKFPQVALRDVCEIEKLNGAEVSGLFSFRDAVAKAPAPPVGPNAPEISSVIFFRTPEAIEPFVFLHRLEQTAKEPCVKDVNEYLLQNADEVSCGDETSSDYVDSITPLLKLGKTLEPQGLKATLMKPQAKPLSQWTGLLTPRCEDEKALVKLDGLTCEDSPSCRFDFSTMKVGCKKVEERTVEFRKQVISDLGENRAVGISVCTSFMKDPTQKTEFCQKSLPSVKDHSFHAMAVTGYRCKGGKIEYEVLNSWGNDSSCPTNPPKTKAFDCVTDKNKKPAGRFWMAEDVLVDSLTTFHSIKEKKK